MLSSIRRFKLVVIALAIVGVGTGIGVSASQHSGYQSTEVVQLLPGAQDHLMRKIMGSAGFLRNVVGDRPYHMNGTPGWIVLNEPANEVKAHFTTQPVSGHVFSVTATTSTPHEAASLARTLTTDFRLYMSPGSKHWMRIVTAHPTTPVALSSSWVEPASIGLGLGLALGLLLSAAFGAFPGRGARALAEAMR